ncbi:MAG TPA: hypothetical protein VHP33_06325 [Polyangiaceae bacterium]|nr:hypothetical protein [Polyangiaceae bacterium]
MKLSFMLAGVVVCAQALLASTAAAQAPQQPFPQQQFPQQQFPQQQFPQQPFPQQQFPQQQQLPRERTSLEIGALYGVSAAYGVGMGVWLSSEAGIEDPGLFLIPPAILGVGGPVGVFLFDRLAKPKRGVPAAIATGALIGAGEGLGIWSYQHVTSKKEDEWSFKALARAEAIGSTLGAVGGVALGYLQGPSPKSSLLMSSSVLWGTAVGSMFGYGATSANQGYGLSNDGASLGGLIGFNVGLAAAAGLSTVYIPTYKSLGAMWLGAGIGFAASLPVYLFYLRDDGPPAKRGLIFSGVTTTLGIGAGALFTINSEDSASTDSAPRFARIYGFSPFAVDKGAGVAVTGELQ